MAQRPDLFSFALHLADVTSAETRAEITEDLDRVLGIARHLTLTDQALATATAAVVDVTRDVSEVLWLAGLPRRSVPPVAGDAATALALARDATERLAGVADTATARVLRSARQRIARGFGRIVRMPAADDGAEAFLALLQDL